jgi:hypothetical protein
MQKNIREVPRMLDQRQREIEQQIEELKEDLRLIKQLRRRYPVIERLCDTMSWSKRSRPGRKQLEKFKRYELDLKKATVFDPTYDNLTY